MGLHEEYLRRNLIHANALGACAGIETALIRIRATKRGPKWLIAQLEGCLNRVEKVHPEVARWRDASPDAPSYVSNQRT
jgi:hypothetical protein